MTRHKRTGHGRWSVILTPCPGILWTSDIGGIGFEPIPSAEIDPTPILDQLAALDHQPVDVTFDLIARLIGKDTKAGDLDTWTPDVPARPDLGPTPTVTSATEVWQAMR